MSDNKKIFREKSLDRVSSPDDLDKYIKSTTPALWVLLLSIIVFLVGVLVWASFSKIETSSEVACKVSGDQAICYIKEEDYSKLQEDTFVDIEDNEVFIDSVSEIKEANEESDSYLLHGAGLELKDWYYEIKITADLKENYYKCKVVYETLSPISFILN